jgi:hypothetical protein
MLLASTFIILALGKALRLFKQQHCFGELFDMGFLIAVASLFYKPALLLFFLLLIAIFIMRPFNWREWVINISGFVTVYFLTGTCFYITDGLNGFIQQHLLSAKPDVSASSFTGGISLPVVGIFTGLLFAAGLLVFLFNFLKSTVQARKLLTNIAWAFVLSAASVALAGAVTAAHFVILGVPLSIIITYLFMHIRRVKFANVLHLIWLALVLFFQYYS